MNNETPIIGKFGWTALAAAGTAIAGIAAYTFMIAIDAPTQRLEDLRAEIHRELDDVKVEHAHISARDDAIEARLDTKRQQIAEIKAESEANTRARLKGGRFTSDDGARLEKMLNLLERRIERIEDRLFPPLYRPQILENMTDD